MKRAIVIAFSILFCVACVLCCDLCLTISQGSYGLTTDNRYIAYNNKHEPNAVVPFLIVYGLHGDAVIVIGDGKIR